MWLFLPQGEHLFCVAPPESGVSFKRVYPDVKELGPIQDVNGLKCIRYQPENEKEVLAAFSGDGVVSLSSIHVYDPLNPPTSIETVVGLWVDNPSLVSSAKLVSPSGSVSELSVSQVSENLLVVLPRLPSPGLYYVVFEVADGRLYVDMFFRRVNALYHRWLRWRLLVLLSLVERPRRIVF